MACPTIPGTPGPQVVLVEDDVPLRHALAFSLRTSGYRVEIFETGEALLLRLLPVRPACLVVDQRLPGISGIAALTILRRRRVELPAILITTNPTPDLYRAAADLDVRIVEKPLLDAELFAAIAQGLGK